MKKNNDIFIYDNIYFEDGTPDKKKHPIVVAGTDENYLYCFTMTSQLKHTGKNSNARNLYNSQIYYVKTVPGHNCEIYNKIEGLIITSYCFTIPKTIAEQYKKFGYLKPETSKEVIIKWAYQQNEIKDKPVYNYNKLCEVFGIDESIKQSKLYKYCVALMSNYPEELQFQREYAKKLRIYNEERYRIYIENKKRLQKNQPRLNYPTPPKLQDNRELINKYSYENFQSSINMFSELNSLLKEETSKKEEKDNIDELKEYKDQLLKLKEKQSRKPISHEENIQEQQYEEQDSQSQYRRAA